LIWRDHLGNEWEVVSTDAGGRMISIRRKCGDGWFRITKYLVPVEGMDRWRYVLFQEHGDTMRRLGMFADAKAAIERSASTEAKP